MWPLCHNFVTSWRGRDVPWFTFSSQRIGEPDTPLHGALEYLSPMIRGNIRVHCIELNHIIFIYSREIEILKLDNGNGMRQVSCIAYYNWRAVIMACLYVHYMSNCPKFKMSHKSPRMLWLCRVVSHESAPAAVTWPQWTQVHPGCLTAASQHTCVSPSTEANSEYQFDVSWETIDLKVSIDNPYWLGPPYFKCQVSKVL